MGVTGKEFVRHVYLAGAELVLLAGCVVLEDGALTAGLVSVSTIVLRCAASGAVGIYSDPRCPQPASKAEVAHAKTTGFNKELAILLPWLE